MVSVFVVGPDNGVFERWRIGVVHKFFNFFFVSSNTFKERLFVVFCFDEVEGYGLVWCCIFPEKGVVLIFAFFFQIFIHNCKCLQACFFRCFREFERTC